MEDHETVLTSGQMKSLCTAAGNAMPSDLTFAVAEYLDRKKGMMNHAMAELVRRVGFLLPLERFWHLVGKDQDFSGEDIPPEPRRNFDRQLVIIPQAVELCGVFDICRSVMRVTVEGPAFEPYKWDDVKDAPFRFLRSCTTVTGVTFGSGASWVDTRLTKPRCYADVPESWKSGVGDYERSRVATLDECLLLAAFLWRMKRKAFQLPEEVTWCLGTQAYVALGGQLTQFHPQLKVSPGGKGLIIWCDWETVGGPHTGVRYAVRMP